uniref:PDZ domain-containing protein n=1 Tax=Arundo donax TaxID=35708 RepID=A0A0A8Y3A0_ARUDO
MRKKLAKQLSLPTLDPNVPLSCFAGPDMMDARKSGAEAMLQSAPYVVPMSSHLDGKTISIGSGFLLEYNAEKEKAVVVTCANIFCETTNVMELTGKETYYPDAKYTSGGPAIGYDGNVVGMAIHTINAPTAILPSSILVKCITLWRKFGHIDRPEVGLKVWSVELLDPAKVEYLSRECGVKDGLVVQNVAEGSPAEKVDIQAGDIILSCNGLSVANTIEFENVLLSIPEMCSDQGFGIGSGVPIELGSLHPKVDTVLSTSPPAAHKELRLKKFTVNVYDRVEVFPCLAELEWKSQTSDGGNKVQHPCSEIDTLNTIMGVPGFSKDDLHDVYDHLLNNKSQSLAFMDLDESQRVRWIKSFLPARNTP